MNATVEAITSPEAVAVAQAEISAFLEQVQALPPPELATPTDCAGWTVRDIVAHVTGSADEAVHPAVQARHMLVAKTRLRKLPLVDALSTQQLADRSQQSDAEVIAELAALAPRVPAARRRVPAVVRRLRLPDPAALPGDRLGYLLDVIYTRDVWMHRIDISRATRRALPTSGLESVVVGQVVRDLQRGWSGPPFRLVLTGHVAGEWPVGGPDIGPPITVDGVALCRLLSGRSDETGLDVGMTSDHLAQAVTERLRRHRILF